VVVVADARSFGNFSEQLPSKPMHGEATLWDPHAPCTVCFSTLVRSDRLWLFFRISARMSLSYASAL